MKLNQCKFILREFGPQPLVTCKLRGTNKVSKHAKEYHGLLTTEATEIFKRLWPPGNNILMIFNLFQSDENYRILAKVVFLR